jgi:NAD+ kinase
VRIAVFGKQFGDGFYPCCTDLFSLLIKAGCELVVYQSFLEFLNQKMNFYPQISRTFCCSKELEGVELMLSIGGDGTFLEAVTLVRDSQIPIAGINSGRLGFLAAIAKEEIQEAVDDIVNGRYHVRELDLLEAQTTASRLGPFNFALNELAIAKRDSSSMITIHAYIDGEFLNTYWADGLIVATSTGSTAYSLSVGGPIMHPASGSFVISPIAPHNLNVRPLVVPNHVSITLKVDARGGFYLASLDSRSEVLDEDISIEIRKAEFKVCVVERNNSSFYATLRNKLMWGADKRN